MRRSFAVLAIAACGASHVAISTMPTVDASVDQAIDASLIIPDVAHEANVEEAAIARLPSTMRDVIDAGCVDKILGQSAGTALAACKADEDCTWTTTSCCAGCGEIEVSRIRAVSTKVSEQGNPYCPGRVGCPRCLAKWPYGVDVMCRTGHCAVVEHQCKVAIADAGVCTRTREPIATGYFSSLDRSACRTADDCEIVPRCCHCGKAGPREVVIGTHRGAASYRATCEGQCDACAGEPGPGLIPECVDGQCAIHDLGC